MADNIAITQGSGTSIATEDVSGVQHQKIKIEFGGDGEATLVSASDPLPVSATIDTAGLATDETDTNTATIASDTTSIDSKIPSLGQALADSSVPVILPAATITTLTPPAAITGFATETTLDLVNAKLVSGTDIGDVTINNTTSSAVPVQPPLSGYLNVSIDQTGNNNAVDVLTIAAGSNLIGKVGIDQATANANEVVTKTGSVTTATLNAETTKVIGTIRVASGGIASGSIASGAIASGAIASGAIAAGAIAAGNTSIAITEDTASADAEHLLKVGARRIDTAATSSGSSGDWSTQNQSAEGATWSTLTPTTTSGTTIFRSIDLDETEEEIKATAGNLYGYFAFNAAATTHYIKFYNATAANVTVGTTTPVLTLPLPAGAAANISFAYPVGFATAITAAATTGIADNDTGAPAANAVTLNAFFK